jgi:hypothetical protein
MTIENDPPEKGKGLASRHTSEAPISQHHRSHHHERSATEEIATGTLPVNTDGGTSGENIEAPSSQRWKGRFIRDGEIPEHAITWRGSKQRTARICAWRIPVIKRFHGSARLLSIAWTIEGLTVERGYAYCGDIFLSKQIGIHTTGIQRGLTELERDGVIVRASVFVNGKPMRRIWLSSRIIDQTPATVTGVDTRYGDTQDTRYGSGTESKQYTLTSISRPSATQIAAKKAAELRQRSEQLKGGLQ